MVGSMPAVGIDSEVLVPRFRAVAGAAALVGLRCGFGGWRGMGSAAAASGRMSFVLCR